MTTCRRFIARVLLFLGLKKFAHLVMPVQLPGEYTSTLGYHLLPVHPARRCGYGWYLVRELSFRERQRTSPDLLLYLPSGIVVLGRRTPYERWSFRRAS